MDRYEIERMEAAQAKSCRELALSRFEIFKSQDIDQGRFDVAFEIEGKIIRAHKFILEPVSEPLKAMMSPPWSAEGETIKIKECSYDSFYEFLCYLYSCDCKISKANVVELTDLAESYSVPVFKDFCDTYLSKMGRDIEEFYEMVAFADKYSLPNFKKSLECFFFKNIEKLTTDPMLMNVKQLVIMFFSTYEFSDYSKRKELFFTYVCKWAEHQALKEPGVDESNLNEAIKKQLTDVIPVMDLSDLDYDFVLKSIMPKKFLFSFNSLLRILVRSDRYYYSESYVKTVIGLIESHHSSRTKSETADFYDSLTIFFGRYLFQQLTFDFVMEFIVPKNKLFPNADYFKFLNSCQRRSDQEDKLFETVYQLAEANVLRKQKVSPETNFNLLIAIKKALQDTVRNFKVSNMSDEFIENFVVAKGILSEGQNRDIRTIKVAIIDTNVKHGDDDSRAYGTFEDNIGLLRDFKSSDSFYKADNDKKLRFTGGKKYDIPETPSTVKKMKGCEWYLCFEKDGTLALKHHSVSRRGYYLLAGMKSDEEFTLNKRHKYKIEVKREVPVPSMFGRKRIVRR